LVALVGISKKLLTNLGRFSIGEGDISGAGFGSDSGFATKERMGKYSPVLLAPLPMSGR